MDVDLAAASLPAALRVVVPVLEKSRTAYALIGRVALQAHGAPTKPTQNIDFALMTFADVPRTALRDARITYDHRSAHSDNWRAPPEQRSGPKVPIRFFSGSSRLQRAISRAQTAQLHDLTVRVATPEDLLVLKLATAEEPSRRRAKRSADIEDIVQLAHHHPSAVAAIAGFDRRLKMLRAEE